MADETKDPEVDAQAGEGGPVAVAGGVLSNSAWQAALPSPVRRNLLKALDRLCSAAVDIPVAILEGKAEERRAETRARTKITDAIAEQIAAQLDVDPSYAQAAMKKHGDRILREQINLDKVARIAARDLMVAPPLSAPRSEGASPQLSDDWLNVFEKEAAQKSTAEMQLLFGRILAGEIQTPSRFSIKTLKLAGELDTRVARLFLKLCSLSTVIRFVDQVLDARVVTLGIGAASNGLRTYGLGFEELNLLNEYGLIIADYNSWYELTYPTTPEGSPIPGLVTVTFQGQSIVDTAPVAGTAHSRFRFEGVKLSRSGIELLPIVDLVPEESYAKDYQSYIERRGLRMVASDSGPRIKTGS